MRFACPLQEPEIAFLGDGEPEADEPARPPSTAAVAASEHSPDTTRAAAAEGALAQAARRSADAVASSTDRPGPISTVAPNTTVTSALSLFPTQLTQQAAQQHTPSMNAGVFPSAEGNETGRLTADPAGSSAGELDGPAAAVVAVVEPASAADSKHGTVPKHSTIPFRNDSGPVAMSSQDRHAMQHTAETGAAQHRRSAALEEEADGEVEVEWPASSDDDNAADISTASYVRIPAADSAKDAQVAGAASASSEHDAGQILAAMTPMSSTSSGLVHIPLDWAEPELDELQVEQHADGDDAVQSKVSHEQAGVDVDVVWGSSDDDGDEDAAQLNDALEGARAAEVLRQSSTAQQTVDHISELTPESEIAAASESQGDSGVTSTRTPITPLSKVEEACQTATPPQEAVDSLRQDDEISGFIAHVSDETLLADLQAPASPAIVEAARQHAATAVATAAKALHLAPFVQVSDGDAPCQMSDAAAAAADAAGQSSPAAETDTDDYVNYTAAAEAAGDCTASHAHVVGGGGCSSAGADDKSTWTAASAYAAADAAAQHAWDFAANNDQSSPPVEALMEESPAAAQVVNSAAAQTAAATAAVKQAEVDARMTAMTADIAARTAAAAAITEAKAALNNISGDRLRFDWTGKHHDGPLW